MSEFAERLIDMARAEAATPEGRARVAAALRRTLAELEPAPFAPRSLAAAEAATLVERLDDVAGRLVILGDEAEWLALRLRDVMPPAPRQVRPAS